MADTPFIARGFHAKRKPATPDRLPPGQYETRDFPVLSAGPTPHTPLAKWDFTIRDSSGKSVRWTWDELQALPHDTPTVDIHCVTKWSKFDTRWEGISVDTLLDARARRGSATGSSSSPSATAATRRIFRSPTSPEARPGLPSATTERRCRRSTAARRGCSCHISISGRARSGCAVFASSSTTHPGFWEQLGYHDRGDPWREQRYQGDP